MLSAENACVLEKKQPILAHRLQNDLAFQHSHQMLAVWAFPILLSTGSDHLVINPAKTIGDFFRSGNRHTLVLFDQTYKVGRLA